MSACRSLSRLSVARGFTFTELLVVMVIAGVLAATVGPKIFGPSAFDEFGYRAELASAIGHAKKTAISARRYVCVSVAAGDATFSLLTTEPESVGASISCNQNLSLPKGRSSCSGNPAHQICPPSGVDVGSASWVFDPLGRPVSSAKAGLTAATSITVANQPNIVIEAETGYVH